MTIREIIAANPIQENESKGNWFKRLERDFGYSAKSFSSHYYKSGHVQKKKNVNNKYVFDRKERALKSQLKEKTALYKKALEEIEHLDSRLNTLISIKEHEPELKIKEGTKADIHDAVPILVYSDWHVEETVSSSSVNGLNEYNLDIADKRINTLFNRSNKLIQHLKTFFNIDTVYVLLNGDMISGYIHEELQEANSLSPTQAIRFAKERIVAGLEYLKSELKVKKIIVQCNYGNHGRSTIKRRHSETAFKNSYEWLMYSDIADYFLEDDTFEFHVAKSLISYYVFRHTGKQFTLRTWHGDNVRFGGGVGGLTIPLNKLIYRLDQNRQADYNIIGHFHTLFEANKRCLVNGSVIGYNAYASDLGLEYEGPKQGLLLLDLNRMEIRSKYTINCD